MKRAQEISGFVYELTGSLGKRTQFQESEKAQLVVFAESRSFSGESEQTKAPVAVALDDDTLLPNGTISFANPNDAATSPLAAFDQSILLAFAYVSCSFFFYFAL